MKDNLLFTVYSLQPSMSFHDSPITKAIALGEQHVQIWTPLTASYHRYWTRAEKKRVYTAIRERDAAFISLYMGPSINYSSHMERVESAIIVLTYLTNANFMFQCQKFRDVVWRKMCEFEKSANTELERINSISSWEEYDKEEMRRTYLHDLLHVIFHLREVLRGATDQTFYQG